MRLVINEIDRTIVRAIGERSLPAAVIARQAGLPLTNTHNKLSRMLAQGFVTETRVADANRQGLLPGERRRLYSVTDSGRRMVVLYDEVRRRLSRTGARRTPSPRSR